VDQHRVLLHDMTEWIGVFGRSSVSFI
jgi:hypothetical protein